VIVLGGVIFVLIKIKQRREAMKLERDTKEMLNEGREVQN
jgi:hypothetical protein